MTERERNIIMDRTFDAECLKRAGLAALSDIVLKSLRDAHPKEGIYIDQCVDVYSKVGDFLTDPRGEWLKEHGITRLRFK